MRISLLLLLLILCGCDRSSRGPGPTKTIRKGDDQLTMVYLPSGGNGFDFDSLVWVGTDGNVSQERAVITQQQFEAGTDKRRWVSDLHSFDPRTGNAIIKVAEGDAPKDSERIGYVYSWREWNLRTNAEVRLIRICKDPFEKY